MLKEKVGEVVVKWANDQGCQFDEHLIQCCTSTDISGIVNEFVQYDQNHFRYVCIPIQPTIGDKSINRKLLKEPDIKDDYYLNGLAYFSFG